MPTPKHPDDRVRRNKEGYDENGFRLPVAVPIKREEKQAIKLPEWDGIRRGHSIPKHPHDPDGWHTATLVWWLMWQDSPHAMFFLETDWEGLFVTAIIYDKIMKGVSHTAMVGLTGELRKREGQLGASIEDRIRLGIKDETDGKGPDPEKVIEKDARKIIDYAERLNKKVAEQQDNPGG